MMDVNQAYWDDHVTIYKIMNYYFVHLKLTCYIPVLLNKKLKLKI